ELAGPQEPGVLVDVGAGTGFFAVPFVEKMGGGKIYACDTVPAMIAYMQENLPEEFKERIIPVQSEENRIPLPDALADLVYMINLHHELEHSQALVTETRRLLRPGGKMMIVDWKLVETPEGPPLSIRVPPEKVREQMAAAGLADIEAHDRLPWHYIVIGRAH
ncbi:MAG: class I SAM-dependent methyltransferase, partial [Thermodesulfobacteriota bacterium]